MNLVLLSENVCIWDKSVSKSFALGTLFETLAERSIPFNRMNAWKEILKREALASSYMGDEFVLSHAHISDIDAPLIALGICPQGITGVTVPVGESVRIFGVLLSPTVNPNIHLEAIRELSRRVLNSKWKSDLLAAKTPQELVQIFTT